jgi:hypothetical protein
MQRKISLETKAPEKMTATICSKQPEMQNKKTE